MVHDLRHNSYNANNEPFVISDYLEFLVLSDIPSRMKEGKYVCPNPDCRQHHLSINADGKQYNCFHCKDNSAIARELRRLRDAKYGNETEKEFKKVAKPSNKRDWIYKNSSGEPLIKVVRTDDGKGEKSISQESFSNGKWSKGFAKGVSQSNCELLYQDEVEKAIKNNELVWIVEGESCCDTLRGLGFIATTNIGGSGKNHHAYEVLKGYPNVVLCPDRDSVGRKHMEGIEKVLGINAHWFYVNGNSKLWQNLPTSGGVDIEDFINEKRNDDKLTNEELKEAIMKLLGDKKEFGQSSDKFGQSSEKDNLVKFPKEKLPPNSTLAFQSIDELLDQNLSRSEIIKKIPDIVSLTDVKEVTLKDYINERLSELETEERSIDLSDKLSDSLDLENISLNLNQVIPAPIANKINDLAVKMSVTPEHLFTALLPAWGNGVGTKSRVVVKKNSGYTQPAIIRTMIVANSGDRKTPILNTALGFLDELERESRVQYQEEMKEYNQELNEVKSKKKGKNDDEYEEPKEPKEKRYILKDDNYDGLVRIHSENPDGVMQWVDELMGRFTRMNKQNGKGDDREKDLSLFNGGSISKDRMGKEYSFYIPKTAVNATGSIQWDTLTKLMKDNGENDSAGAIARWLICCKKMPKGYIDLFDDDSTLFDDFKNEQRQIFQYLRGLREQDYLLSFKAKGLWQDYQHYLVDALESEKIEAMAVAYPKFESYMSRIALVYHLVESYFGNGEVNAVISGETMKKAIDTVKFFECQYRLVLAKASPTQSLTGDVLKIRDLLIKSTSLTISQVTDRFKHLRGKEGKILTQTYFDTLVNSNIAEWVGSRKSKINLISKVRTSSVKSSEKFGQFSESLKTNSSNISEDLKNSKFGQVRTKFGKVKTITDEDLDSKFGKKEEINNYFETENENLKNSPSVSNSEINSDNSDSSSEDLWNEDKKDKYISDHDICPNLDSGTIDDEVLSCPNFIRTSPNLDSETNQGIDLSCPNFLPNLSELSENISFEVGQKWNYRKMDETITTIEIKCIKNDGTILATELLTDQIFMIEENASGLLGLVN